jgi:hypothetical protein
MLNHLVRKATVLALGLFIFSAWAGAARAGVAPAFAQVQLKSTGS